jgi:hypothetical protein
MIPRMIVLLTGKYIGKWPVPEKPEFPFLLLGLFLATVDRIAL